MQAEEILTKAKAGSELPQGWVVFPLLRNKVLLAIFGWACGIFMGMFLFFVAAPIVIPSSYQHGIGPALLTTLLLAVFLFIGLGSLWALIMDVQRLRHADKHLLVLTPDDFVKQEGDKIIHVPCANIRHVTARGTPPPDRTPPSPDQASPIYRSGENVAGLFLGRRLTSSVSRSQPRPRGSRKRTPTTLAFVDTRTESEVIITNDNVFGDVFHIAALLKQYAANVQQMVQ